MSRLTGVKRYTPSCLPIDVQLDIHLDVKDFRAKLAFEQVMGGRTDQYAEIAHNSYQEQRRFEAKQLGFTAEQTEQMEAEPEMDEAPAAALDEPVITDHSYDDGYTSIEISTMRMLDTDIYIADVEITDPSLICTALAEGAFGRNLTEPTSVIAERNGAIFAVNGDYYGFRSTGYVMRNGYLYRSVPAKDPDQEDLVLYENGSIDIVREADMTAEEIRDLGARDIFSFGPGLVMDGEISVSENDEVERAQVTNPRTAIGLLSPLHYLFVVSDGRTEESVGLSLYELAILMKDLGCTTAYNLDGGGSSTMWFNGRVLNRPTTFGDKIAERSVSDIVFISK